MVAAGTGPLRPSRPMATDSGRRRSAARRGRRAKAAPVRNQGPWAADCGRAGAASRWFTPAPSAFDGPEIVASAASIGTGKTIDPRFNLLCEARGCELVQRNDVLAVFRHRHGECFGTLRGRPASPASATAGSELIKSPEDCAGIGGGGGLRGLRKAQRWTVRKVGPYLTLRPCIVARSVATRREDPPAAVGRGGGRARG